MNAPGGEGKKNCIHCGMEALCQGLCGSFFFTLYNINFLYFLPPIIAWEIESIPKELQNFTVVTTETKKTKSRLHLSAEPICSWLVNLAVIWLLMNYDFPRGKSVEHSVQSQSCKNLPIQVWILGDDAETVATQQNSSWSLPVCVCVCLPWGWTLNVNTLHVLICPLGMRGMRWKWRELILGSWRVDFLRWLGANNKQCPGVLVQEGPMLVPSSLIRFLNLLLDLLSSLPPTHSPPSP